MIEPFMVPMVQLNDPGVVAVRAIEGTVPLQTLYDDWLVTAGTGLTVTVIREGVPGQDPSSEVGVTIY